MKKTIYILLLILSYTAYSQSLSVFNVDASNFPTIKAKFFAFDSTDNQITNLNTSDFEIKENGIQRAVTNISCPEPKPLVALSTVLVMDVSGSMAGMGLDIAKSAANAWINMVPLGKSECAITSFSDENYINQDFTIDKKKLIDGINSLNCLSGTDYNAAMLDVMAGGVLIAKTGKYKRVIVLISDGYPNAEPNTAQIISQANANNIAIYCVTIGMSAPQCMKDFSNQTGGLYFENIRTKEEAEDCYRAILMTAQGGAPCLIEWQSGITCVSGMTNAEVKLIPNSITAKLNYQPPNSSVAKLEIIPPSLKFKNAIPCIKKDTIITVTARNSDFNVTNITSSNPAYTVNPTSFFLINGQSQNLTASYIPADSGYTYTKFTIENDKCAAKFYASGGYPGKKAKIQTLKLIQPNGGETFIVGMDTVITWDGVLPEEKVKIEYTTDNGANWILIMDSAIGLSHKWLIPKTPSNNCLARVTANLGYENTSCDGGDVQICNQIWMACNLDVDAYRDGTTIPEVTDPTKWANLTTGAWCYYNNDPNNGIIYGKLYNWYAVNDPRGLAPEGWHIPSIDEWNELENCLGGVSVAGGKLKSTGTKEDRDGLWRAPNTGATNESSFSGLPGGYRGGTNWLFYGIGSDCFWWSSTTDKEVSSFGRGLGYSYAGFSRYDFPVLSGFSVRCVKD
ncbi:MAG: FISUMP domain-containing protein [bacterium]